ncbi:hypothetical protein Tco_1036877, partial [Tanacetum coccineum]
ALIWELSAAMGLKWIGIDPLMMYTVGTANIRFLASEDDSTSKLEHLQSTVNELDHMDPPIHAQIARLEATIMFMPATTTLHVYDVAAHHVVNGVMEGVNGTPPHDIIEEVAQIIISTIPYQRSETQPTRKDSSSTATTAEPKPASAKWSLLPGLHYNNLLTSGRHSRPKKTKRIDPKV